MGQPDWVPEGIDTSKPSASRAYDYLLGGAHNFAADREFVKKILAVLPDARLMIRANRAFLHRAVRFMVEAGIRQFLDIGSGIPTVGNVHEIAQEMAPEARVMYVDIEPVAIAHSRQILAGNDRATAIQEDLRHPQAIMDHPEVRALLALEQPLGLLLVGVLHVVPDEEDPFGILTRLYDGLCPGSYVAISHATTDVRPDELGAVLQIGRQESRQGYLRSRAEVLRFFTGLELVEPGLVWTPQWRPDSPEAVGEHPERMATYAGVGRKP